MQTRQLNYWDHVLSIVRPSLTFRLLLCNCCTEFNETWLEARSQHPLPNLCFSDRSENQDGRPGLWLTGAFSTSTLQPLNGIQRNLIGSKYLLLSSSTKFVFFVPIRKPTWSHWSVIGKDNSDFSSANAAEFNDTWQEGSTKYSLPSISGRS